MIANPFDLRGPEFLGFYGVMVVATLITALLLRRRAEAARDKPPYLPKDPYELAFLKGGKYHLLRVAIIALVDRGLLRVNGRKLKSADPDGINKVNRPLDKAILERFIWEENADVLFHHEQIKTMAEGVGEKLEDEGLLPDKAIRQKRHLIFLGSLVLIGGVAAIKIYLAIMRGRYNLAFLGIGSTASMVVLYFTVYRFRTQLGSQMLKRAEEMLSALKERKETFKLHNATNELTLLAAVFGIAALPSVMAATIKPLRFHQTANPSGGCGSGCSGGSSCGGSSCGGGCGGGGCGGCGG